MSEEKFDNNIVSVIIPIYNAESYISSSLESVFAQTYESIEIVLVDDCSTDNSVTIVEKYKRLHPEIIYYLQEENMGAGIARNKALELATGRYVAFLDSDDLWMPDKIEKQLKLMHNTKSPFSYTAIEMIDENSKIVKTKRSIREECSYNYLLYNTIIATSSVVIDRKIVGDFRMSCRRGGQDYATWLKLLRKGIIAKGINEPLVRYRVRGNSLSSNKLKSIKQVWEIQTQDEKINKFIVALHIIGFSWNALKKYFI